MDTECSNHKDNGKRVTRIFFILIAISNIALFVLAIDIKGQLNRHNEILLTVPPDLQRQILENFKQISSELKSEVLKQTEKGTHSIVAGTVQKHSVALDCIKKSVDQDLLHYRNNTNQQLDLIKSKIDKIDKNNAAALDGVAKSVKDELLKNQNNINAKLASVESKVVSAETKSSAVIETLAGFQRERAAKTALYLDAARASIKTPETAQILYVSALTFSDKKAEILSEFIDWQTKLIKQDLKNSDIELAQERLMSLANVCDTNIAQGSVEDMKSIPALKNKLKAAEQEITSYRSQLIANQQEQVNSYAERVDSITSYSEADALLKELTALSIDSALSNQKDDIAAKILLKQSYMTAPDNQLIIPAVNNDTPWNEWLKNFAVRLNSNLSTAKKLEDLGAAAEFLQTAKASNSENVKSLVGEIEKAARGIYITHWKERVERITASEKSNLNDISALMAESNTFSTEEQKESVSQILKLNKYITKATLSEFAEGLKHLKALENSVADETYVQMVGTTQGQYIQLLLRLKALDTKFANEFSMEINDVTQKIADLGQRINAYKNKLVVADLKKNEAQRSRFVSWARIQLSEAENRDKEGEKIAEKWGSTRNSPEAVAEYRDAWHALMIIHPGDLQAADPALHQRYIDLKNQIEKHWTPDNHQRTIVKYKRISDF